MIRDTQFHSVSQEHGHGSTHSLPKNRDRGGPTVYPKDTDVGMAQCAIMTEAQDSHSIS
jgi:hypothetical protein